MASNNWYVITGGPSTGKTTLLAELEKKGYKVVPEAARTLIDDAIDQGISVEELRRDEKKFQEDVALLKIKIESSLDPAETIFFDRGMHDTLAYMRHYEFAINQEITNLMQQSRYKNIFLLQPLDTFTRDYARTEDQNFLDHIHQLLHDAYTEFGMKPILVPKSSPRKRADFILQHIS